MALGGTGGFAVPCSVLVPHRGIKHSVRQSSEPWSQEYSLQANIYSPRGFLVILLGGCFGER